MRKSKVTPIFLLCLCLTFLITRPVEVEYPILSEYGNYTAYAYPSESEGSLVQQSFKSSDVPNWLITEGLIVTVLCLAVPCVAFLAWATKEEKWSEWFEFD